VKSSSSAAKCFIFGENNALVKISATMSLVGLDVIHTLLSNIQNRHLESPELSHFTFSENAEGRAK